MEEIDWSTEWWRSPVWVLGVWVLVMVGFALLGWLLIRRTGWGRQFWRLSSMYFIPFSRSWQSLRPILTVALLLLLTVMSVRLDVLLSFQGNELFTALQENDQPAFWRSIVVFAVLATVNVVLVLITFYIGQAQLINWRLWLNQRMVGDWMTGAAYHRGRFVTAPIDNPDQRIQADITSYASLSQGLALGMVSSMVTLVSFTVILWGLSGPLEIGGITIPRAMVFLAYIYVIIATVIAFRIGRPLIRLNFLNERLTASYRYALVRVRENSENIAFYRGEQVESSGLLARFSAVIANVWAIVFRSLKFQGFNLVVNQIAVVFPILIQAPRFFAGTIQLGDVTQTATAFGNVQGALSFFRTAYDDFAGYRAVLNRLTGLLDSDEEARDLPGPDGGAASVRSGHPRPERHAAGRAAAGGQPAYRSAGWRLGAGQGAVRARARPPCCAAWPGCGRTSRGRSAPRPRAARCSAPSSPTCRSARSGPRWRIRCRRRGWTTRRPRTSCRRAARAPGRSAGRGRGLVEVLSPGEQQRLSFGRILLARPALIFLDESTSALDEGMEYAMYALIRQRLPGITIVSVGHRSTLDPLHTDELRLVGDGRWEAKALVG